MNEGQLLAEIRAREKQIEQARRERKRLESRAIFDEIWQRTLFMVGFLIVVFIIAAVVIR